MSEYLSPNVIKNRINRGKAKIVDDELEVECSKCHEFFPHTREFYYGAGHHGLSPSCRACDIEHRENRKSNKQ